MAYRPTRIEVTGSTWPLFGRWGLGGFVARIILRDDGLPARGACPVHGYEGPVRTENGTIVADRAVNGDLGRCRCSVVPGFGLEQGPYYAWTHRRAWRKALRAAGGKLYPTHEDEE